MNLLCMEEHHHHHQHQHQHSDCFIRASLDPVLLDDERVLRNLLDVEEKYAITASYFKCVQTDIKAHMRPMVATWMLEVCEDQNCQEGVFSLAMNYMDRFLSMVNIHRSQLQLLGAVCLFLASKMKDSRPLAAEKLCMYTAQSISLQEVTSWELLVLSKLKWDLWAITPHDFLDYILRRLPYVRDDTTMIKRHSQTFMTLCATDFNFSMHSPSIIAAASVGAAVRGLMDTANQWTSLNDLLARLHDITNIETDVIRSCLDQIEEMLTSSAANGGQSNSGATAGPSSSGNSMLECAADKTGSRGESGTGSNWTKAATPTDVRDVLF